MNFKDIETKYRWVRIPNFEEWKCPECGHVVTESRISYYCTACGKPMKIGLKPSKLKGFWVSRKGKLFMEEGYNCVNCGYLDTKTAYCGGCGSEMKSISGKENRTMQKKKYFISIPAQEIEVMAESMEEAWEEAWDRNLIDYNEISEEAKAEEKFYLPLKNQDSKYYIERMFKDMANPTFWIYKTYFKDNDMYYYSDGRRVFETSDEITEYKDITGSHAKYCKSIKQAVHPYNNSININIDIKKLLNKINYSDDSGYNIKIGNTVHSINKYWLLEGLYFTNTTAIKIGFNSDDNIIIENPDLKRKVVILPRKYEKYPEADQFFAI